MALPTAPHLGTEHWGEAPSMGAFPLEEKLCQAVNIPVSSPHEPPSCQLQGDTWWEIYLHSSPPATVCTVGVGEKIMRWGLSTSVNVRSLPSHHPHCLLAAEGWMGEVEWTPTLVPGPQPRFALQMERRTPKVGTLFPIVQLH